ncbi:MAG: ABC transporter ATP-binding protein [Clostridia bacterium]|nr:ABC transporter ATP-binding protein [Clostridia bacterium]
MEILKLENVYYTYQSDEGETNAVEDLSFSVNEGEFVSIIGPSGSGKTTVLSLISGLLKATKGKIYINGKEDNSDLSSVGYMLQRDHLFSWRTIEKNVYLPLEIKKINTLENRNRCLDLLKKYGLKDFIKSYPDRLSGGMRQRVAIIRTLASNPNLLLLDEPFSALDYQTRLNVCDDVYSIIQKEKKTTLLVTHDISEAISMSDRVIVLTKRPAKVLSIHTFNYDKSIPPLKRRELPTFGKNFEILWRELNYDGK